MGTEHHSDQTRATGQSSSECHAAAAAFGSSLVGDLIQPAAHYTTAGQWCIVRCSVTDWWLHPHILPSSACPSSQQHLTCLLMNLNSLPRRLWDTLWHKVNHKVTQQYTRGKTLSNAFCRLKTNQISWREIKEELKGFFCAWVLLFIYLGSLKSYGLGIDPVNRLSW